MCGSACWERLLSLLGFLLRCWEDIVMIGEAEDKDWSRVLVLFLLFSTGD